MTEEQAQSLLEKLTELYRLDKYHGRHKFKYLISRYNRRKAADKLLALLVAMSLCAKDMMTHKLVTRAVVVRQNLETISTLISLRTNLTVDLNKTETITTEHIKCMKEMITHLGMHDLRHDFLYKKNLLFMANLNDELSGTLESHMLMKARRYKNFYNLLHYVDNFEKADKHKFFVELFKNKKHFSAKIAIERLERHPELKKYSVMK